MFARDLGSQSWDVNVIIPREANGVQKWGLLSALLYSIIGRERTGFLPITFLNLANLCANYSGRSRLGGSARLQRKNVIAGDVGPLAREAAVRLIAQEATLFNVCMGICSNVAQMQVCTETERGDPPRVDAAAKRLHILTDLKQGDKY